MDNLTVSMELLTAKAKRPLGLKIETIVQRWLDSKDPVSFYKEKDLKDLSKIVETETGMFVDFVISPHTFINAYARVVQLPGHQGSSYSRARANAGIDVKGPDAPKDLLKVKIDLDKGHVSGAIYAGIRNRVTLTSGLIKHPTVQLNVEEITSVILHELGHVFNQYMTLGEYVWLNYLLQDGVEVVMGKKPNVYKLEVLSADGLEKWSKDKDLIRTVQQEPNEANIRRAILSAHANAPRHHITKGEALLSNAREEQLADLFASRMGYAKAAVTAQVKADKTRSVSYTRSTTVHATAEALKVVTTLGAVIMGAAGMVIPVIWLPALALISVNRAVDFQADSIYYDRPLDRLLKFRLDLVGQLKLLNDDPDTQKVILDDIKVIDSLTKDFKQHTTAWEMLTSFMLPSTRRQRHQRTREQRFERLMNNDLFVVAQELANKSRKA